MRSGKIAILLVLAVGALVGCERGGQATPTPTPTPTPTTATSAPTESPRPPTLGSGGFGALKLGMTKQEAAATGLTINVKTTGPGACGGPGDGYLLGAPKPDGDAIQGRLFFSSETGRLGAIYAFPGVTTPEGIGLGSTYDELHAAYPNWKSVGGDDVANGRGMASAAGGGAYRIVVLDHKVVELSLDGSHQDCYE